jgi:hypothetical protein
VEAVEARLALPAARHRKNSVLFQSVTVELLSNACECDDGTLVMQFRVIPAAIPVDNFCHSTYALLHWNHSVSPETASSRFAGSSAKSSLMG